MESPPMQRSLYDRFVTGDSENDIWIWVIEYFAKFKTELSMLHDVFEMAPKLPDYLGEHTNEMVSLRCLASLFDSSISGHINNDANSKIEFDSSESCQYVLQCILDEIPLSELKPGAPGLSKWNLLPFIRTKLLRLPKCALELMVEEPCENDTETLSCKAQESRRSDGKETETDQVASRAANPDLEDSQSFGHGPGDGDDKSRSHTSLDASSPSEIRYRCIQCKRSGKLLFCSGEGCQVMVHEECLDSTPSYDDDGNFYCSLCSSTCVSAEYLQSLEEVTKAKKKLASFLRLVSLVSKK